MTRITKSKRETQLAPISSPADAMALLKMHGYTIFSQEAPSTVTQTRVPQVSQAHQGLDEALGGVESLVSSLIDAIEPVLRPIQVHGGDGQTGEVPLPVQAAMATHIDKQTSRLLALHARIGEALNRLEI